jgi:hypothetical protein
LNIIKEDDMESGVGCTTSYAKSNKDEYNKPKTLTVQEIKGSASINNTKLRNGQKISPNDTIKISDGGEITFQDIKGMGMSFLSCKNGVSEVSWVWE